jgi:hypothetical protein
LIAWSPPSIRQADPDVVGEHRPRPPGSLEMRRLGSSQKRAQMLAESREMSMQIDSFDRSSIRQCIDFPATYIDHVFGICRALRIE